MNEIKLGMGDDFWFFCTKFLVDFLMKSVNVLFCSRCHNIFATGYSYDENMKELREEKHVSSRRRKL